MTNTFDKKTHTYEIGGRTVPGVTTVLADTGLRESFFDNEHAADKGTMIHLAIHYLDTVGLAEPVDPKISGYVQSYKQWKLDSVVDVLESEYIVFYDRMGYGCIIDKIARFVYMGKVVHGIVEVKSGQPQKSDRIQTAGQTMAMGVGPWTLKTDTLNEYSIREYGYMRRFLLYIKEDTFTFYECTDNMDLDVWRAGTILYNWKRRA